MENNMVWLILIPTLGLAAVGAWLSYSEWAKGTWYLFVGMILLTSAMGMLWSWAVSAIRKNSEIMAFSLAWDVGLLLVYCCFPLIFSGEKLTVRGWAALLMAVIAVVWFKIESSAAAPHP